MAAFLMLALMVVILLGGEIRRERVINATIGSTPALITGADAAFVAYKSAVQTYVFQHPGISGSVPLSALDLDAGNATIIVAANTTIRTAAGTQIITWATPAAGIAPFALQPPVDTRSTGFSMGNSWSTPAFGNMGALPLNVPVGDIVSVVTFSGTGFSQ